MRRRIDGGIVEKVLSAGQYLTKGTPHSQDSVNWYRVQE